MLARRRRDDDRIVVARGLVLVTGVVVLWLALGRGWWSPWWTLLAAAAFVGLVSLHDRVIAAAARAQRVASYYQRGLERLAGQWVGSGRTGETFVPADHLYAVDLDCVGLGSVFELLCTARTGEGERVFAGWLLSPATVDEMRARQQAVEELRGHVDLREALALAGEDVRRAIDTEWLVEWGVVATVAPSRGLRLAVAGVVGLLLGGIALGPTPLVLAPLIALHVGTALALRGRVSRLVATIDRPARDLATLAQVLGVLERARFESPRLQAIAQALVVDGQPPSVQVDRLRRLVDLLDARRNQMFIPFALVLLWTTQLGLALAAWRARCGPAIGRWVTAVAEIEALLCLAQHAYEHPDDAFPELVSEGPVFEGTGLAHPLLPPARAVRNDIILDAAHRLLVVSGSNMSGKSTMLRTIGVNAALAMAGGTVCARRLRLSPLVLGASIRVTDSLLDGRSRFYAEILRLRDIVERARTHPPLLFLLDEILGGTNSHDRRIGAEAVVRALMAHRAIGLVTTHDLALTGLADTLAPAAANVHFADQLVDGELHFDYRMHPGVVTHSNALALMRAVGIDV